MNDTTTQTYKVPSANLPGLVAHIEKLNKKVEKLLKKGFEASPVVLTVGPAIVEKRIKTEIYGCPREIEKIFFPVTIVAQTIKVAGWEFVATLQHEEGGTIVRAVPGATIEGELASFRNVGNVCNHCGFDRKRNDTFILRKGN
jgi:hypothetical protein